MLTSIKKATRIIETLASGRREWTVAELARHTHMPQPTVHHFLVSFRQANWIVQDPATRRYRLGTKLWEIGCASVSYMELAEAARPFLRALVDESGETAHLGMVPVEDPHHVVYVDRVDSAQPVRVVTALGSRAPTHCSAMGKAIVAHNPEFERVVLSSTLEALTPLTLVDVRALRANLALTRQRGYSMSVGEFMAEMVGIAAPVYDRVGTVTIGVGLWAPSYRMTKRFIARIAPRVVATAAGISRQLGHMP